MLTVPAMIAPHAPHDGKQPLSGDVAGTCYICGVCTDSGQLRPPSDVFTAWASCGAGDVLCPDCARTLNWRDVRMFSWLATPDGVRFEGRGDRGWLWGVLLDPPEPPYAVYVTQGGQKQGWISGARQVTVSARSVTVLTDWTDRPVVLTPAIVERYAPLILRLRGHGIGRNNTRDGTYTATQWRQAIIDGYDDDLREAERYAGDPRWQVMCHVSIQPDDPDDGSTGERVAAGTTGARDLAQSGLPLG